MSLAEKIAGDLMAAMKAQDKGVLEALRAAKTAFILARSEKGPGTVIPEEEEIKIFFIYQKISYFYSFLVENDSYLRMNIK